MAQKDFATIEVLADDVDDNAIHDERPVQQRTIVVWVLLAVALVMAALAGGFWLGHQQGLELASSKDKARLQALIQKQQEELQHLREQAKKKHKVDVPTTQVGDLTFYNDLPNQGVNPTALHAYAAEQKPANREVADIRDLIQQEVAKSQDVHPESKPKPVALSQHTVSKKDVPMVGNDSYQIQVASFQEQSEALRFVAKLKKHGFDARVRTIHLPRLGVWHRVYTGHYTSREQAHKDMKKLSDTLHVTGLVVRQ